MPIRFQWPVDRFSSFGLPDRHSDLNTRQGMKTRVLMLGKSDHFQLRIKVY
jgi:hypothetical protein